jgi:ABC-type polysaccharide/polyol phosphate transport system ATPase subunit
MSEIILSCTGITKSYERSVIESVMLQERLLKWGLQRKRVIVHALQGISVALHRGEWLGIYGHNGSGKTTLLRILAGLLQADTGEVFQGGSMSCFFELGIGFHPERKAEENIYLHGLLQGFSRKDIRKMTDRIIEFAGIQSHVDLPIKCYSTGMKMRLAFAAAAQVESDIYLLDEVLAVGDVAFQYQCLMHMRAMREAGKTVVLVAHGYDALQNFCDRILTLEHGRIIKDDHNDAVQRERTLAELLINLEHEMLMQRPNV